jgi:hypothetical protein
MLSCFVNGDAVRGEEQMGTQSEAKNTGAAIKKIELEGDYLGSRFHHSREA